MLLEYRGRQATFDAETLAFQPVLDRVATSPRPAARAVNIPEEDGTFRWLPGRYLERLVLNVANYCNLDCVYCYAQGGDYGGPHEKMTYEVGRRAFDRFYALYDQIATVQFFGGEPLLNAGVIEQLCEYGWLQADKLGRPRPMYTIITNGTVMSQTIIDMIRRYEIRVTVSIDGPPEINDRLRISRAVLDKGTSKIVEENIRWLKAETGQPAQAEGTFTRLHVEERCSVNDVLDYLVSTFSIGQLHMPINVVSTTGIHDPYALREEDFGWASQAYADAVARTIHSLVTDSLDDVCLLRSTLDIIEPLLAGELAESPFLCPAGNGTIAVDSNGKVYPCFMFYRMQQFELGSVVDAATVAVSEIKQSAFLSPIRPILIPEVAQSWAGRFVHGCAGGNYFKNGHQGAVSRQEVELIEAMASAAVVELAHLSLDESLWNYLPYAIRLFRMYQLVPDV